MFTMRNLVLVACLFRVCLSVDPASDLNAGEPYLIEVREEDTVVTESAHEIWNGTLFKTIKKYYCHSASESASELILYGTKTWLFPAQDANLTLRYPSEKLDYNAQDDLDYILTGLQVILQLTGSDSKGYITSGGLYQDNITMTFVLQNITSLSYQFYLYGVPRNYVNITENYTASFNLC